MRTASLLITTAILLFGLTACGQKGPLYLPTEAPAEKQSDS